MISVVIPMYNSQNTIVNSLESIINQTRSDLIGEIIVVDDGSTDYSVDVVENYILTKSNFSIKLIKQKNGGVSAARNAGMNASEGTWIALLDSDDQWKLDKVERQYNVLEANKNINFLGGGFESSSLKILLKNIDTLHKATLKEMCIKFFPSPCTVIFKKQIYNEIGGFDESISHGEEADFFFEICEKYGLYYIPEELSFSTTGKSLFGESGLSSNLSKMYHSNVRSIKKLRSNKSISHLFYFQLRIFYFLKYVRRILMTIFRNLKGNRK